MTASAPTTGTPSPTPASLFKPCIKASGPSPARIMLVGEAPGEQEEAQGLPFVGTSGKELRRMLKDAGVDPSQVYMTNVLWTRPPNNKLEAFMLDKKSFAAQLATSSLPILSSPIRQGKYLHPALSVEVERLYGEIAAVSPHVILALGNTALWALTGQTAISKFRGTVMPSLPIGSSERNDLETQATAGRIWKVLPTYHPAAVVRQWDLRVQVVADLLKAARQSVFPEIRRPQREIICNPDLDDIRRWIRNEIVLGKPEVISCDVETRNKQITEIGFSARPDNALVIPFIRGYKSHYWQTAEEEAKALDLVREIHYCGVPFLYQNGLYDLQYTWKTWGIYPRRPLHDTMLKHHSLFPELPKGLGFLGSIYTEEPAWKILRHRKDHEKSDDE